jgi:hypothetical protein
VASSAAIRRHHSSQEQSAARRKDSKAAQGKAGTHRIGLTYEIHRNTQGMDAVFTRKPENSTKFKSSTLSAMMARPVVDARPAQSSASAPT